MITDRSYQTEAVQSLWNYFSSNTGNPIIAMPTGTGKSIVIARFLQSVFAAFPHQKVLILTHVKELIQQNYHKLEMVWEMCPAGVYSAGLNSRDTRNPIIFAGIASVAKRFAEFGHVDLVIIDEAHLVSPTEATMYRTFLAGLELRNKHLKVIGLTATPWRLGHGKLTDTVVNNKGEEVEPLFTDFCFDITGIEAFNRLIAEGFLIPLIPKRTKTVLDVDGVHMRGGEFIEKELQTAVDKDELTHAALQEAVELGANRKKWLIFASGVNHADHIGEMLSTLGIPTGVVHSKREGRDRTIADFKAGRLQAVVNNNVLTTGFDDPEIDMIVCLRPTASAVLWVQMLGRGTRPLYAPGHDLNDINGRLAAIQESSKHNCLVLDYAANTKRLGPINDPVVPRKRGQGGGTAPVKCCEACNTYVHASLRWCPTVLDSGEVCNHEFKFETKLRQGASSDELVKGDIPIVEVFKVDQVSVASHNKVGAPPMMKVSYYCGYQKFDEYVCPEHQNFAQRKARQWWKLRTNAPLPETTKEALEQVSSLPAPTHIRVWINKKYPELLATCFDGSAFGTQEPDDTAPEVEVEGTSDGWPESSPVVTWDKDDEIPF